MAPELPASWKEEGPPAVDVGQGSFGPGWAQEGVDRHRLELRIAGGDRAAGGGGRMVTEDLRLEEGDSDPGRRVRREAEAPEAAFSRQTFAGRSGGDHPALQRPRPSQLSGDA